MSRAVIRLPLLLLAGLLLGGCAGIQQINLPVAGAARSFTAALDQYMTDGDPKPLKALPEGEWRTRADYILALAAQKQKLQAQLAEQKTQLAAQEEELKSRREEVAGQKQEIKKLEQTLTQLKEVLIDTELKPK